MGALGTHYSKVVSSDPKRSGQVVHQLVNFRL